MRKSQLFLICLLVSLPSMGFAATHEDVLKQYLAIEDVAPETKGLSEADRRALFQFAVNHPVASPRYIQDYEPFPDDPRRSIGYCFGRAMTVHLKARKM